MGAQSSSDNTSVNNKVGENQTGLHFGIIFCLFLSLFFSTISTAALAWQTTSSRNYWFKIGLWKWCAISKNSDQNTVCGETDKNKLYPDSKSDQDSLQAVRTLAILTCSMVAIAMLMLIALKPNFHIVSGIIVFISLIINIIMVSLYSTSVYKNADMDEIDTLTPIDPDWNYGFAYWFGIVSIIFLFIALILYFPLVKSMKTNGATISEGDSEVEPPPDQTVIAEPVNPDAKLM